MTDKPATRYLYGHSKSYLPNTMHQAYLDAIPQTLEALASDNGFATPKAQAEAIAGAGAAAEDLDAYMHLANHAYMYFTEMGYRFEPTAEDVEAFYTQKEADYAKLEISRDSGKTVDIRHILLIPQNAQIAQDGTESLIRSSIAEA